MINKLKFWLRPKKSIFKYFDEYVEDFYDFNKRRIFIDRGSNILFIAHLDTVCKPPCFVKRKNEKLWAVGLDDRLGCLIAYELSQRYKADLLLTDLEESGKSTAQWFNCGDYNWIVEFDRRGDDVVTYGRTSKEFEDALGEFWEIGEGSFSDICFLETNVCCMNLGIGYEKAHSDNSYVNLSIMNKQLNKFREFFYKYKDTKFEQDYGYQEKQNAIVTYKDWQWNNYYQGNKKNVTSQLYNYDKCDFCGNPNAEFIYSYFICEVCFDELLTVAYYSGQMDDYFERKLNDIESDADKEQKEDELLFDFKED